MTIVRSPYSGKIYSTTNAYAYPLGDIKEAMFMQNSGVPFITGQNGDISYTASAVQASQDGVFQDMGLPVSANRAIMLGAAGVDLSTQNAPVGTTVGGVDPVPPSVFKPVYDAAGSIAGMLSGAIATGSSNLASAYAKTPVTAPTTVTPIAPLQSTYYAPTNALINPISINQPTSAPVQTSGRTMIYNGTQQVGYTQMNPDGSSTNYYNDGRVVTTPATTSSIAPTSTSSLLASRTPTTSSLASSLLAARARGQGYGKKKKTTKKTTKKAPAKRKVARKSTTKRASTTKKATPTTKKGNSFERAMNTFIGKW